MKDLAILLVAMGALAGGAAGSLSAQAASGSVIGSDAMAIQSAEVVTTQSVLAAICSRLVDQPTFCRNDDFSARFDLHSDVVVHTTGTNISYSGELGELAQSGDITSAWWQWTAPANGVATIDTFGSDFDTILTLAGGGVVHGLSLLDQNDDAPGSVQSEIVYSVTFGNSYQIAVDGFGSTAGQIALNIVLVPDGPL